MFQGYLPEDVRDYMLSVSLKESVHAKRLREYAIERVSQPQMMSLPEQTRFLAFLLRLIQAKKVLELGVYVGYSTLVMAEALSDEGIIIACDTSDTWPKHGMPFWQQAGVEHKIQFHVTDAKDCMQLLLDEGHQASFDLIFIDADKVNYEHYVQTGLKLLRGGGLMVVDDTLWVGEDVFKRHSAAAKSIDRMNQFLKQQDSLSISQVPIGSGMTLVYKLS